ncbi:MAG: NRDE family protein [Flavobacteriaceae bacterium]
MCILSYAPTNDGFVLSFNRDEVYNRVAKPPEQYTVNNQKLIFPKDTKSGGSWIGVNITKSVVGCVLNAKGKTPKIPSNSRGNIFINQLIQGKANLYENELDDIAPFTLLSFCLHTQVITQYLWDGFHLKRNKRTMSTPFILCSTSLYENSIMKKMKAEFNSLIASKSKTETTTTSFHKKYFFYKNHPIYLKKSSDIQTVSMTTILKNKNGLRFNYTDLVENTKQTIQF